MAHMLLIEDIDGDVEEGHWICSDSCHRTLADTLEVAYKGWLGCIELEFNTFCECCGDFMHGIDGDGGHDIVCEDSTCDTCSTD